MPKGEALLDVLLKSAHNAEEEFLVDMTYEEKDEFERLLNIALKTVESD